MWDYDYQTYDLLALRGSYRLIVGRGIGGATMTNNSTCPLCNKKYRMGWNGTVDGCDKCLGIIRDEDGYVYELGETEITLMDVETGKIEVRQRPGGRL